MKKQLTVSLIASGTLATTLLLYGISNSTIPNVAHAETTKATEITDDTKEQELIIENSSAEKIRIQNLMLNSIDNYKKASGTFEYFSKSGNFNLEVNYQTDVSNNPRSYEKVQPLNNQILTDEVSITEISVYDGETLANVVEDKKAQKKGNKTNKVKLGKISKEEREELKNSTIKDRVKKVDGEKSYYHRVDPSYMGVAKTSLFPEDIAMGFLEDIQQWEISGSENIAGVNTVIIKGNLNKYYAERYKAGTFTLNVDPNTGILLNMEVVDNAGRIKESINTISIKINDNLNEKLFKIE